MEYETPEQRFERAVGLHRAGRLAEAEALYRAIVAQAPEDFRALHLLGVVELERGRGEEALRRLEAAVRIEPRFAAAWYNRGNALLRLGRLEEALASYERALALRPDDAEVWYNRGLVLQDLQRHAAALESFERALAVRPDYAEAYLSRGRLQQRMQRLEAALADFERAASLRPGDAWAHNSRGVVLRDLQRPQEALASYDRALALQADAPEILNNRGNALQSLRRSEEALASFDRALALQPDYAEAHNNRGAALKSLQRPEEALASFERALAARPDYVNALINRGAVLHDLDRPEEALASYDHALALRPADVNALLNRGVALHSLLRPREAIEDYRQALAFKPDAADIHWNLSLCQLLLGDYARGWAEYEWRWRKSEAEERRPYGQPVWLGREDLRGRTVLLTAEQGLGDTLQFCRYATAVAARGARVILEVQAPLQRVLGRLEGVSAVVARGEAPPAFDYQCPLMSLPLACGTTAEERIPAAIPYLGADADAIRTWRERLGPKAGVTVGVAWSGYAGFRNDRQRSLALATLLPLRESGVRLISLQKEVRERDRATLEAHPEIEPWGETLTDFADTAGLIGNLDLVISVDTAVAHLAGALGKPVWVLLPYAPDWRWQLDRTDSPWYPTARLYRQPAAGDWDSVVDTVARALKDRRP